MLDVEQDQHQRLRPRGAEGGRIRTVGRDLQALELEDGVEGNHSRRDCNEGDHHTGCVLVCVLEQQIEGDRGEQEEDSIDQVGDDSDADKSSVRDHVRGGRCGVAGDVHLRIHEAFGEAAKDGDE